MLAPDLTIVNRETLVSDGTNRAHTTLVGDLLVTPWDETPVWSACVLTVSGKQLIVLPIAQDSFLIER